MSSPPSSSSSSPSSSRPKARKKPAQSDSLPHPQTKWQSGTQERLYSSRLVDALQAARSRSQAPVGSRAVKEAADSALALTARGRSRWSRAILLNRHSCKRKVLVKAGGKIRRSRNRQLAVSESERKRQLAGSEPPRGADKEKQVEERLKRLGKIVPGCKKLSPANLLEEAADYVAALELQVRTMRALAEALSAATVSGGDVADPMVVGQEEERS
ncbi:hypothetical protein LUZ60_009961 [Juncus effusus]|nr:hypothetical protein LUZ60_009961 [Juncus effusus]